MDAKIMSGLVVDNLMGAYFELALCSCAKQVLHKGLSFRCPDVLYRNSLQLNRGLPQSHLFPRIHL